MQSNYKFEWKEMVLMFFYQLIYSFFFVNGRQRHPSQFEGETLSALMCIATTFWLKGRRGNIFIRQVSSLTCLVQLEIKHSLIKASLQQSTVWRKEPMFLNIVPRESYSIYPWVGRCGPAPHTLTLFKTNITDFNFLPCLRQNCDFWYPV